MHLKAGKFITSAKPIVPRGSNTARLVDQNRLFPVSRDGARLCRHAGAHGFASLAVSSIADEVIELKRCPLWVISGHSWKFE
jgi:hypothetical protein